jgi:hypothetical protein
MELTSDALESITPKVEVGARISISSTRPAIFETSEQSSSKKGLYASTWVATLQLTWPTFPPAGSLKALQPT